MALGFKPRHGSHTEREDLEVLGKEREKIAVLGEKKEKTAVLGEKGERTRRLWWRREKGPRGFGEEGGENHAALAEWGPRGSDTADGARSLNHRLLLLFLQYGTPDWAEGEGRTVCIYGYSKGL